MSFLSVLGAGDPNAAVNAAAQQQQQQQAAIQQAVNQIQTAYNGPNRQAQYGQYGTTLNRYYDTQVNNQEAVNARNLKFAMARSGLTGGSAAVDTNTQLQKDYTTGLLQASQAAQSGVNALKQADVNSENQLIGLAQQGNLTGQLPTMTAEAQNTALGAAQSSMTPATLGSLFTGTANIYNTEQTAAANRKAQYGPYGSPYG